VADLARVPGLGNARAEKIRKILDSISSSNISNILTNDSQTTLIINASLSDTTSTTDTDNDNKKDGNNDGDP
jgi:hypothetical protein